MKKTKLIKRMAASGYTSNSKQERLTRDNNINSNSNKIKINK